jgi:hypothetical protein
MRLKYENAEDFVKLPYHALSCFRILYDFNKFIEKQKIKGKFTWFNSIVAVYYGWRDSRNKPEEAIKYGDNTSLDVSIIEVRQF